MTGKFRSGPRDDAPYGILPAWLAAGQARASSGHPGPAARSSCRRLRGDAGKSALTAEFRLSRLDPFEKQRRQPLDSQEVSPRGYPPLHDHDPNTGDQNATNAVLNDTIDNNTVFVPGSLQTTPIARNDSYSTVGNVQLTPVGSSVLQNDSDPDGSGGLSVTAHNPISLNGGTVSMSVNGSFDRDSAGAPLRHIEYTP